MKLCSRCKKRPAVVFVANAADTNSEPDGLCLVCAKELGIKPIDDMLKKMDITDDDIAAMSEQFMDIMSPDGDGIDDEALNDETFDLGTAPAIPFLNKIFGFSGGDDKKAEDKKSDVKDGTDKKPKKKRRRFTEQYCTNLTERAREGKLDRIIGRDKELYRTIQILSRRTKNNPCLIGEPGVGKSTLLLQVCARMARMGKRVLYVTGEESTRQIRLRADRLGVGHEEILVLAENAMDAIEEKLNTIQPDFAVIDSIQTMYRPDLASAPGSVSQVRESAALLMRYAKTNGCAIILVGHVTKEGAIAGPRVLEHMVDVVLYFEGDYQHEYRLLRAVKNRFGSVNELGMFEMTGEGMMPVENASETLISHRASGASGSVVFCCMEGSRPMLVDLQALAAQSFYAVPRRTVNGADQARVALLLAVLEKRAGLRMYNQDVYVNVAGGLSLSEPAVDLPLCVAVASSLSDSPLPSDLAVMGEVGLTGEIRAITQMERRINECVRLGFRHIMCPADSVKRLHLPEGVELTPVKTLAQAITLLGLRR